MKGNFQGDLADVVRDAVGNTSLRNCSNFSVDQLPLVDPPNLDEGFGDPFSSMRDPLLMELEGIHGDFITDVGDESSFQISSFSDDQMRISCTGFAPINTCDLRGDGLMNVPSSPKSTSSTFVDTSRVQISSPRNPIVKRRKSQAKKVVCIPAPTTANTRQGGGEVVPSDLWAWRKYGQKPIKGSPYPRGYYRCSSSKGCSARKQVERSRTDPNMLVITYTSEHNHPWPTQRNSLAGSSRITASTSSNSKLSPPPPQSPLVTTVKEEKATVLDSTVKPVQETVNNRIESENQSKQNNVVLPNQMLMNELVYDYDESYRPVMQDNMTNPDINHQDFFTELRELEEIDQFSSLFDWSTSNSNANTTTTNSDEYKNKHENNS